MPSGKMCISTSAKETKWKATNQVLFLFTQWKKKSEGASSKSILLPIYKNDLTLQGHPQGSFSSHNTTSDKGHGKNKLLIFFCTRGQLEWLGYKLPPTSMVEPWGITHWPLG